MNLVWLSEVLDGMMGGERQHLSREYLCVKLLQTIPEQEVGERRTHSEANLGAPLWVR